MAGRIAAARRSRRLIEMAPDLTVVGAVANGAEALAAVARCRPDVVLMDIRMPVLDGIEATRRIVRQHAGTPVRVLVVKGRPQRDLRNSASLQRWVRNVATMTTALVTGASRGLGAVFASRLARDGHDLVLVARDLAGLERTAAAARRTGVSVEVLVADLTDPQALEVVQQRLADTGRPVDLLVNNAGAEGDGEFVEAEASMLQAEIDTNITAVMHLTRAALPAMIARGRGGVVNVASFAGYLPSRGNAYSATKAWVLAFTDTVAASLPGTGVGMIALCPGRMRTGKRPAPAGASALWLEPEAVVNACLADLARGRTLCTPGLVYRGVVGVLELPRRSLRTLARIAGRGREGVATTARSHLQAAA